MSDSRRARRDWYARHHQGGHGRNGSPVKVPGDVATFEGDGSPCFMCGQARGCRHQPTAEAALNLGRN